ncbi:helix-turn-helix domain-containing protein [Vallitalea sp.]|uniref:helix-turn-helix domain-containing protein n=1 Tax=Vallitalea sp. TaxID=1882829 RepID=UPI0025F7D966|nr:helix-turn-helix transcriptional regulator [Vallitalea sp.]MCT4685934.1 helix-turn-helix domain-containing protein [Vallitalea sp.]
MTELQRMGYKIKDARLKKKLKQKDLAMFLGKSKSTISCYENGKKRISIDNLKKLCNLLELDISSI